MADLRASWDEQERRELMLACDGAGRITAADASAERKLGPCVGKPFLELIAPGLEAKAKALLERARSEKVDDCELPVIVDKNVATISFCAKPDASGGVLLLGTYVPEHYANALAQVQEAMHEVMNLNRQAVRQRRATQRQNTELEEAQAALKVRADFEQHLIGIVSHDLRNPINGILLGVEVLLHGKPLDDRTLRALTRIRSSAERATRLISDLLDFTMGRLGGGIPLSRSSMELGQVVRTAVDEVKAAYPDREVRLQHQGDVQGVWDGERLAQVVSNLVSNACKYSPAGTPVQVATGADGGWASISVQNQGAPIAREHLTTIFDPMQRSTTEPGTARSVGLGLYIVTQIAEGHGGSIDVTSNATDGTTFTVRLPRAEPPA